MSPEVIDTTKLDQAAERYIDAQAAAEAAQLKAAAIETAAEHAFADLRGAAASHATLHGGRARRIADEAIERVKAKLSTLPAAKP